MARPTKLTPEVREIICKAIVGGNYKETAAQAAGIDKGTLYNWLKAGEAAKSGAFFDFFNAVKKAESEAELRNVVIIQQAAKKSWQAAAWYLERKHRERWGRNESLTVTITDEALDKEIDTLRKQIADAPSEDGDAAGPAATNEAGSAGAEPGG